MAVAARGVRCIKDCLLRLHCVKQLTFDCHCVEASSAHQDPCDRYSTKAWEDKEPHFGDRLLVR
jgi:hypothetical protein